MRAVAILTNTGLVALVVAMIVPFSPLGAWFGFQAPPFAVTCSVGLIVVVYLVCAELLKAAAIGRASRPASLPTVQRATA